MNNELWLIWKQPKTRQRYKIGMLTFENNEYIFQYVNPELEDAIKDGFDYFPGFVDIHKTYKSDELFTNIETRLPNPNRPDYLEILNIYNLNINSSKWEILKSTKGRLLTDGYEFVLPFNQEKIEFDIAGTRYYRDSQKYKKIICINDKLDLELEPLNKFDSYAIKVILNKNNHHYHLGYVPKYYTKDLNKLLQKNVCYSALVSGLNFESEFTDEDISVSVKLIFND